MVDSWFRGRLRFAPATELNDLHSPYLAPTLAGAEILPVPDVLLSPQDVNDRDNVCGGSSASVGTETARNGAEVPVPSSFPCGAHMRLQPEPAPSSTPPRFLR